MGRGGRGGERGETLLEILFAIMIMGVAGVALIASMTTSVVASDAHRRLADTEVVARSYGEALKQKALHPASTTLTGTNPAIDDHNVGDNVTVNVASSAGFPLGTAFTIAIDGEIFAVPASASGTSWANVKAQGAASHAVGATVEQYKSCPSTTDMTPTDYTVPASSRIVQPTVLTVEYFDVAGNPISDCANYWNSAATVCSLFNPQQHLTVCDPALIRATIDVHSTDTSGSTAAKTNTRILVRRGDG